MRDTNYGMIQLLDAVKEELTYSALIKHKIEDEELVLKFGIIPSDYGRLKRILEFRPYEDTCVAQYNYFFALSYSNVPNDEELINTYVRVEQQKRHKQYEFQISKRLMSNILWFNEIKSKAEVKHLIVN